MAENTQAVDPVQKPQEIQTGREQDLQKDVSNGRIQLWKAVLRSGRHLRYMEQGIPRWWIMQRRT